MCHANAKEMMGIKQQCLMDKGKDLNSNYVDSAARAHAGKYKELTTIGNAELCPRIVRCLSVATMASMLMYIKFSGGGQTGSDNLISFLHLLTFAAHFGSQFWVTFIAGFAMYFNLPRIMFGRLQSRLFPIYFATTLVLSCVTFVTFTIRHPYKTMSSDERKQLIILGICMLSSFINCFFMAPQIVSTMVNVFEMEKDSRVAYVVGFCDRTELKKNPAYCECYKQFRLVHSLAGVTNVVSLVCNVIYLYYLACV